VYTRVHLYGAQRRATREKYSSITFHHSTANSMKMVVQHGSWIVRILAVLRHTFVRKISHVRLHVKESVGSEDKNRPR